MATPPTRVSYNTPALGYGSTTATKATPAFDVVSGDLITFIASSEGSSTTVGTPSASGGSITWTSRQSIAVSNYCTMYLWTGVVGATATGITVQATASGGLRWSFGATVWRNHGGVGTTAKTNVASGAPSLAVACSANSAIVVGSDDWNAVNGSTRTWRTVNGAAITESLYSFNSGFYTVYSGYRADTGTAGTQTVGLSAPSGQKYSIVAVEVLGTTGGGGPAFSDTATLSGSGTLTNAATPAMSRTVALSGSGTLAATAAPAASGSAALSGSGTLATSGTPRPTGAVTLSGSGTLTATGSTSAAFTGSAALSGSGTLGTAGAPAVSRTVSLTGSGSLTLGGTPGPRGSANLSGSGSLTASGTPGAPATESHSGLVMLTGAGSLEAAATGVSFTSTASLGGHGTLAIYTDGPAMYLFRPPARLVAIDPTGQDFLYSKVHYPVGDAVIKYTSGSFRTVQLVDPDELDVEKVYLGGHDHVIPDAEALPLIQAGYGEYMEVIS